MKDVDTRIMGESFPAFGLEGSFHCDYCGITFSTKSIDGHSRTDPAPEKEGYKPLVAMKCPNCGAEHNPKQAHKSEDRMTTKFDALIEDIRGEEALPEDTDAQAGEQLDEARWAPGMSKEDYAVGATLGLISETLKRPKDFKGLVNAVLKKVDHHEGPYSPAVRKAVDDADTHVTEAEKHLRGAWDALRKIQTAL